MTEVYINSSDKLNTSQDLTKVDPAEAIFIWIVCIFEFPVILLTLFALFFLVKSHRASSVYVIHLILSDLLQIGFIFILTTELATVRLWSAYKYCLTASLVFMACIAIERYLLVSHPHWYKSHHSVKMSCFVSVVMWLVPLTFSNFKEDAIFTLISECLACFIPYSLILMSFIGTWRGLSHAISLTSHKRRFILGSLSLVLLNYTFLILPLTIINICLMIFGQQHPFVWKVYIFCHCLLYLNPLADCLLYLFMRSDAESIMKSLYCCGAPKFTTNTSHTNMHSITVPSSVH